MAERPPEAHLAPAPPARAAGGRLAAAARILVIALLGAAVAGVASYLLRRFGL